VPCFYLSKRLSSEIIGTGRAKFKKITEDWLPELARRRSGAIIIVLAVVIVSVFEG
jgi:hypothetical protein